jgi:CubicO group peptidase (beta-lactamase class C family)
MTHGTGHGQAAGSRFTGIWQLLDGHVASGRVPGYVAAVRLGRESAIRAGGRTAVEPDSPPMTEDTLFRIASVTKPMGGVLTMSLVDDGVLGLDDPAARWLPELERPRVVVAPDAGLEDTTDAVRPITVRHLITCTTGWGAIMQPTPLQRAMIDRGVFPSALQPPMTGDEFVATLAGLPLAFQPGDGFLYDTPIDVLGVLLARAAGRPLSELFAERILGPLGMTDTAFHAVDPARLATAYMPSGDGLELLDPPDGEYARPPRFEELSSGLVSTVADVLRFYTAMADGGAPVVRPEALARMTADALTQEQRRSAVPIVEPGSSWAMATGVDVEAAQPWMAPGRWGWTGGTGTTAYVDPSRDTVCVLLTQRGMGGPRDGFDDLFAAVAAAA